MPNGPSDPAAQAVTDLAKAAVAEFGGFRAASRALNIPLSTLHGWVRIPGITPIGRTVERFAESFQALDEGERFHIRAGADALARFPDEQKSRTVDIFLADPEEFKRRKNEEMREWVETLDPQRQDELELLRELGTTP